MVSNARKTHNYPCLSIGQNKKKGTQTMNKKISELEKEITRLEMELIKKENSIKELLRVNQKLQDELHLTNYNKYKNHIIIEENEFNNALALLFALNKFNPFKKKGN